LKSIQSVYHYQNSAIEYNYSYYPILFDSEEVLIRVRNALNEENIFPRRYFYPSLNKLPYLDGTDMPNAESISSRILCLPLFPTLSDSNVDRICEILTTQL
jgi:dTDP-4-amino-4,6-dideoxygalactose transaminase